jgi:acyl-CoA reductase-like NAD-dependent aldehyde dehydrogenase
VKTTGKKVVSVGGKQGTRIVLSFKLTQTFAPGVLRLNVIKSKATGKAVTKVRISLPARTGSTAPGKRVGERLAKKGTISIPLGMQTSGTLRLVVTATAGTVTLSGTGAGSKAPTIVGAP